MFIPNIIDLEASGFGRGSYPIEVGFITSEKELGCCLIKPIANWVNWDLSAEKIHGIERSILDKKGKPIEEVALWLNDTFKGQTIYTDAWMNDMCWLGLLYEEADISQNFKLESLLSLFTEEEREMWTKTYQSILGESKLIRHRASNDAKLIQKTYLKIKQITFNENRSSSV